MKSKRATKGMGSVSEYLPGKWRGWVDLGNDIETGKRLRKSFTGKSHTEVVNKMKQVLEEKRKGVAVINNAITFYEFSNRWLDTKENRVKLSSYMGYKDTCKGHFKDFFGHMQMQKVTTAVINNYLNKKMKEGRASSSLTRQRTLLHNIFELAVSEGVIGTNPVRGTTSLIKTNKETHSLLPEDIEKILETAKAYDNREREHGKMSTRMYPLIYIAIATGARRGELLGLQWDAIDFDLGRIAIRQNLVEVSGEIIIDTPKTDGSRRVIAVGQDVLDILKELKDSQKVETEWVFTTRSGQYVYPSNIAGGFKTIRSLAGLSHIRFHDLRHTHATLLIGSGVDMKTVSSRIGHKDIRTTLNLYTHVLPENDRKAASLISSFLRVEKKE